MTATVLPLPRMQFFDVSGNPLSGGLVYSYSAGTTTPKATYTDSTATVQNSNPVTLDSSGGANIWISGDYKIVLTDVNGVQQWSVDGIQDFHTADNITATSTTSLSIGAVSKIFTTQTGKYFSVGSFVLVVSAANNANYMHGQVTAYSGNQLTVNVTTIGGSGTHADWTISLSGPVGPQGVPGGAGAGTGDMLGASNLAVGAGGVANAATARTNLGLGTAAIKDTGTSAGQVLLLDGSAKIPAVDGSQITNLPATSTTILLGSQTASSSSTLDFTSLISSAYDEYFFVFKDLKNSTTANGLMMRVSLNNGSSYVTATGNYSAISEFITGSGRTTAGSAYSDKIQLTPGSYSIALLNGIIWLHNPNSTVNTKTLDGTLNNGGFFSVYGSYSGSVAAINAVRFYFDIGNITSGKIYMYGIKNS